MAFKLPLRQGYCVTCGAKLNYISVRDRQMQCIPCKSARIITCKEEADARKRLAIPSILQDIIAADEREATKDSGEDGT